MRTGNGERRVRRGNFLKKVSPNPFKDFQNNYYVSAGMLFCDIFVIVLPEDRHGRHPKKQNLLQSGI